MSEAIFPGVGQTVDGLPAHRLVVAQEHRGVRGSHAKHRALPAHVGESAERGAGTQPDRCARPARSQPGCYHHEQRLPVADHVRGLQPEELLDESLYDPCAPLAAFARQICFEITRRPMRAQVPEFRSA